MKSLSLLLLLLAMTGLSRNALAETGLRPEINRPMACSTLATREELVANGFHIEGGVIGVR